MQSKENSSIKQSLTEPLHVTLSVNLATKIYVTLDNHVKKLNNKPTTVSNLGRKSHTKRDIVEAALQEYFYKHKIQ